MMKDRPSVAATTTHAVFARDAGNSSSGPYRDGTPVTKKPAVLNVSGTKDAMPTEEMLSVSPPTEKLAEFEPFVRWILSSSVEELASPHCELPFIPCGPTNSLSPRWKRAKGITGSNTNTTTASGTCPAIQRVEVDAECESVADMLSVALRERGGIQDRLSALENERDDSQERIALLESRIAKHLQDRDLAISEKYTATKEIVEMERWKATLPSRPTSPFLGFLKRSETRKANAPLATKEIEKLEKEVADTKLETALVKTELDSHYFQLRQLEKARVTLKLELAQASALEDDLTVSIEHLHLERARSLEELQQMSPFSLFGSS